MYVKWTWLCLEIVQIVDPAKIVFIMEILDFEGLSILYHLKIFSKCRGYSLCKTMQVT